MKRVAGTLGALLVAATLAVASPSTALGATGTFDYTDSAGHPGALHDPASHTCIEIPGGKAVKARNLTNSTATIFDGGDCEGNHTVLPPGRSAPPAAPVMSVIFT